MESGRFSQSPAFFKRAGHNVEGFLPYVPLPTAFLLCTLYPALLPFVRKMREIVNNHTSVSTWQLSCIHKHLKNCQKTIKLMALG